MKDWVHVSIHKKQLNCKLLFSPISKKHIGSFRIEFILTDQLMEDEIGIPIEQSVYVYVKVMEPLLAKSGSFVEKIEYSFFGAKVKSIDSFGNITVDFDQEIVPDQRLLSMN